MKICGDCYTKYDERDSRCPMCGSRKIKHTKDVEKVGIRYDSKGRKNVRRRKRINENHKIVENKRKNRNMIIGIGIGVIVIIAFIFILSMVINIDDIKKDNKIVKENIENVVSKYEENGDYDLIITYINENVKDIERDLDIKEIYERSVEQYKKEVIGKSNEYLNNEEYSEAANILETAIKIIGEDTELEYEYNEVVKRQILQKVDTYKIDKKYEEAIKYINDNIDITGNDTDILTELSVCEDAYRNNIIEDAFTEYKDKGYEAAITIINNGLMLLSNDTELENKKKEYAECAPVPLSNFTIIDSGLGFDEESEVVDVYGNSYMGDNFIMGCCHGGGYPINDGKTYAIFYLDGKYTNFKGTYFINEWFWKEKVTDRFTIYADDILVYDSGVISYDTKAVDFDVDIGNADKITIKCECSSLTSSLALVNASVYKKMQ